MICVLAHFSQRATWPPNAAVRQCSIADITLSFGITPEPGAETAELHTNYTSGQNE